MDYQPKPIEVILSELREAQALDEPQDQPEEWFAELLAEPRRMQELNFNHER